MVERLAVLGGNSSSRAHSRHPVDTKVSQPFQFSRRTQPETGRDSSTVLRMIGTVRWRGFNQRPWREVSSGSRASSLLLESFSLALAAEANFDGARVRAARSSPGAGRVL